MYASASDDDVPDLEERARLITHVMQSRRGSEIGQVLAERAALISSVKWLGNHVPVCVLNRLGEEIRVRRNAAHNEVEESESDNSDESDDSNTTPGSSFSDEMVQTQDLLNEIRREREEEKRKQENPGAYESFITAAALKTLSEDEEDDSDQSLEYKEIIMPRRHRRFSKEEINEYSFELDKGPRAMRQSNGDRRSSLGMERRGSTGDGRQRLTEGRRSSIGAERRRSMDGPKPASMGRRNSAGFERRSSTGFERRSSNGTGRMSQRRCSTGGRRKSMRESYQSFGEMSELSFDSLGSDASQLFSAELSTSSEGEESFLESDIGTIHEENPDLRLPFASTHECALLFVDISGFTQLSTMLDPEKLSKVINAYFELIVNLVTSHGGDVLKFAGDAIFAEWQASPENDDSSHHASFIPQNGHSRQMKSLPDCVAAAATCGARIVQKCSDYPVFDTGCSGKKGVGEIVATLNVHCGLGVGDIVGVHVGCTTQRREYLIIGDPIDQVARALESASLGELHASPEVINIMADNNQLIDTTLSLGDFGDEPVLIARKNLAGFTPKAVKQPRRCSVTHLWEGWDTDLLEDYRRLICSYAHPVVVDNELHGQSHLYFSNSTARQRQVEEAEIRSVYAMFISMPRVDCTVGKNENADIALFALLNNILNLVSRELERFSGHLRQFIVDDKGLVLIATFGLRGSTSPNMVAENALPATLAIHNALDGELNVFNRVGATVGNAYCGVVGGINRHEYAVMGPSVNLAARLMASPQNPGILVSEAVRIKAGKVFAFKALPAVKAKGYEDPVPIFEPLSSLERRWGVNAIDFVGRSEEISTILSMAKETLKPGSPSRLLLVSADSGTGKTTLVVHVIAQLRRILQKGKKRHHVAKHICSEGDILVPFSIFRSILPEIVKDLEDDSKTLSSGSKSTQLGESKTYNSGSKSGATGLDASEMEWDAASRYSMFSRSSRLSKDSSANSSDKVSRLLRVVQDLEAPKDFLDLLVHHLLGVGLRDTEGEQQKNKIPNIASSVGHMVKLFQKWMRTTQLAILAIDDVHLMDNVSWQVVQRLLESTRNIFVVCTSRSLNRDRTKLHINPDFWVTLTTSFEADHRFLHMKLNRLGQKDIRTMIAKTFDLHEKEIDDDFHRDIYNQSRGMPAFANEILKSASRRNSVGRQIDNRVGWTGSDRGKGELTRATVGDIIVHRIDTFDQIVRAVLNLGAVLGASFDLHDIVNVAHRFANTANEEQDVYGQKVIKALQFLVDEGILLEVCMGGETEEAVVDLEYVGFDPADDEQSIANASVWANKTYTFCHDVWRSSILNLMLESRRKQIHKEIAGSLEAQSRKNATNYGSQLKIWNHWKAAEEPAKAANLSLAIGDSFEELGMQEQSATLYEDTLDLWRAQSGNNTDGIGGFSLNFLGSINRNDLECLIKVHIALGKVLANLHRSDSVIAYQNALQIMQAAPSSLYIRDRSLVFPIFSGLFQAIKFGQIEQDEACLYEQTLVRSFVSETKRHGDPVHYTRALSMQAEMYGRLQDFDAAFAAFDELTQHYDTEKLSADICKAYGSDRCAQCYGLSVLWHMQLGNAEDALETCQYIFEHLLPKMDPKNVHNITLLIYPTIWAMKDQKRCTEMLEIFVNHIVEAFDEYFGEGAFTFCLPVYDPIMMLLDICSNEEVDELDNFSDFVNWALELENLKLGTVLNTTLGHFGRDCNSISAEICLCLARRSEFRENASLREKMIILVKNGLSIARGSKHFTREKRMYAALMQVEKVLQGLESLARTLDIEDE